MTEVSTPQIAPPFANLFDHEEHRKRVCGVTECFRVGHEATNQDSRPVPGLAQSPQQQSSQFPSECMEPCLFGGLLVVQSRGTWTRAQLVPPGRYMDVLAFLVASGLI